MIEQQPPLSPRSALRSLQAPRADDACAPPLSQEQRYQQSHHAQGPSKQSAPAPVLPAIGMPPPRSSSLAANGSAEMGPNSHLHLPLPPQPIFEDEQLDLSTQGAFVGGHPGGSLRSPPPQVGMRGASRSRHNGSRQQSTGAGHHVKGFSSTQSIHSASDTSSIASFPLLTPPDANMYQHHTQFPLPSMMQQSQQSDRTNAQPPSSIHARTSSMQNNHEQHQLHQHLQHLHYQRQQQQQQQRQVAGEEESPFAYTVTQGEPASSGGSVRSFYSHPEYHSSGIEHSHRYGGQYPQQWSRHSLPRHALPARQSSRQLVPEHTQPSARSTDDYLMPGNPAAGTYVHARHGVSRSNAPSSHQPFAGRNSYDSAAPSSASMAANGRVLAPLRHSSSSLAHRPSLPHFGSDASPPRRDSGVPSVWRSSEQHLDVEHLTDAMRFSASPRPLSPALSSKRPRQRISPRATSHFDDQDYQQHAKPAPSFERRSRSSDRASVRSLDSANRASGKESSGANKWSGPKLSHEEVMARLKEKMLERIAAKEAAASASVDGSNGSSSTTPAQQLSFRDHQSAAARGRGDSVSSSVPSTPATSVVSVGSPALANRSPSASASTVDEELRSQVATTASADIDVEPAMLAPATGVATAESTTSSSAQRSMPPIMGIESLLSAAAINDQ